MLRTEDLLNKLKRMDHRVLPRTKIRHSKLKHGVNQVRLIITHLLNKLQGYNKKVKLKTGQLVSKLKMMDSGILMLTNLNQLNNEILMTR